MSIDSEKEIQALDPSDTGDASGAMPDTQNQDMQDLSQAEEKSSRSRRSERHSSSHHSSRHHSSSHRSGSHHSSSHSSNHRSGSHSSSHTSGHHSDRHYSDGYDTAGSSGSGRSSGTLVDADGSVRPIDNQNLNDDLKSVISDYWKDRQAPGFTGYKENREKDREEEVRLDEKDTSQPTRHTHQEKTPEHKKSKKKKSKNKKSSKLGKTLRIIAAILILMILAGGGTFAYMRYAGQKNLLSSDDSGEEIKVADEAVTENAGKTVTYKGVTYTLNENISTILFIGVDRENYNEDAEYGEAGQSDTIFLTAINHETGETKMIPISRNTMVAVDEYNADGSYWRQKKVQLALAFAYGDGQEGSCQNVAKSVSRLLYGMPINKYVCIDLSCISKLNDAVGGVEVTVLEDLTYKDPAFVEGETITLMGDQAEAYVRTRKTTIDDDSQDNNAPRMARQKQYMLSFINKVLSQMKKHISLPLNLYNAISDEMVTDITPSEVVYYGSLIASKGFNNSILSIDGKVKHGDFTEFYPDEDQLYQLVLDTFYERN